MSQLDLFSAPNNAKPNPQPAITPELEPMPQRVTPSYRGRSSDVNREGLTLNEWTLASWAFIAKAEPPTEEDRLRWLAGEDPTDMLMLRKERLERVQTQINAVVQAHEAGEASDEDGGDLGAKIMRTLERMNARSERENRELQELHAEIRGCTVEELEQQLADEARANKQRKPIRPDGDSAAPALPQRRVNGSRRPRADAALAADGQEPSVAMRKLTERQKDLLGIIVVKEDKAVFGSDEVIPDWLALKEVMIALGGQWAVSGRGKGGTKRKGGFVFPEGTDVEETIRLARENGEVFDPKLAGYFWTSDVVGDRLVEKLMLVPGARVLEPSAGTGQLVKAVRRVCQDVIVRCVELLQVHRDALVAMGCEIVGDDFLGMNADGAEVVDAVAMNPPFGGGGDAAHVIHATHFLRPGGTLAAIVGGSAMTRMTGAYPLLQRWVQRHGGGFERIDAGAFAEAGTNVRTILLWGTACEGCHSGRCLVE